MRKYPEVFGRLICPNANTLEGSLDQYESMVKEKTLADPCKAYPRWLQILPSTEQLAWKRFRPVLPTYAHEVIEYGVIEGVTRNPHRATANRCNVRYGTRPPAPARSSSIFPIDNAG